MTTHGLGSCLYGFLNSDGIAAELYGINKNIAYKNDIILVKPLELCRIFPAIPYINDDTPYDEERREYDNFIMLSTKLNIICYYLYNNPSKLNIDNYNRLLLSKKQISYIKDNIKKELVSGTPIINEHDNIIGIDQLSSINIDEITEKIILFLSDYKFLMATNKEDEHYIAMPINYLLYDKFDGIANYLDDRGNAGSVSFILNNNFRNAGSFKIDKRNHFKILKGCLIFNGEYIV